ncbi:tyrosine-protein phosphatase [Ectobacillus ponti]|uniref:Tyrosine-protein phosphatase n=1 Tax=Ectobacillus ponti TaxID=2961894 RepID=A0AA41X2P6_9BACI|nr:CpsB/CapC family capsule biosynthesis tyrosine phosphatase [Ectobacillus ponti]MCP8967844.1 tyrosine protein phosphatase [Ectobacillus ponti]
MIDIHAHILPGLDDGAQTMEEAIEMAQAAVQAGIHTIIATPHHGTSKYENEKAVVMESVRRLNEELGRQDIALRVLPGQEVRIYGELLQDLQAGKVLTLNDTGEYLLVEFPSNHVPRYVEALFYDLQCEGVTPIIAHPERNAEIIGNPDILYNLVQKGALAQVTAASLSGGFGKKIKKFSMQLVKHHLIHFIASDAHNVSTRSFKMKEGMGELEQELGQQHTYLLRESAAAVVSGGYIHKEDPKHIRIKKILGGLF